MRTTRFEKKILAAILVVAVVPLAGTVVLGRQALLEVYRVGVNREIRARLEESLGAYRDYFASVRHLAERTTEVVAADEGLLAAARGGQAEAVQVAAERLLGAYPELLALEVTAPALSGPVVVPSPGRTHPEGGPRPVVRDRALAGLAGASVRATYGAPADHVRHQAALGEVLEVYTRLDARAQDVAAYYFLAYAAMLLFATIVAVWIGVAVSRRVTRRVAVLAEATARVGQGDLAIEVPTGARDEVGELTRSFNRMVRDLRESRERLEYLRRIAAWQDFARRLAHEIKNPLTPIQLAVQELHARYHGADPELAARLADVRAIVEEEVATLRRLVGTFSAFGRLPVAELAPASLADVVAEYARAAAPPADAQASDVHVEAEPATEPLPVLLDEMLFKRCLENLVRNAAEAGRPGETARVRLSVRRQGRQALLDVDDDGPGVPEEERDRIFDPYFTTKGSGTGLGLAIVKKIILEHRGTITCAASPLGGARFSVALPLREGAR